MRSELEPIRSALSRHLYGALNLMEGLAGLIAVEKGITRERFEAFATELVRRDTLINNIAVAPGNVVQFIFPVAGNERVLGLDYAANSTQWPSVQRMMADQRMVIAGPVPLIQGGVGVIGRTPVYVQEEFSQGGPAPRYWGLVSTVLKFDELLANTPILKAQGNLKFALRGADGLGSNGSPFWGDVDVFDLSPVVMDVVLPSGSWQLAATPRQGWTRFNPFLYAVFHAGVLISLAISGLVFKLLHTVDAREHEVERRKAATEALAESEQRLRQLAENIDDALWLSDLEHRVFYVSPAYEKVWGQSRESFLNGPAGWLEHVHKEDLPSVQSSLHDYVKGSWDQTFRILRSDGSVRWVRARTYPVRDANGSIYRIAAVSRDVTDYRLLEEQFRQAQKMEAIGRLAGGVAHDFNNLLSVILGYTKFALDDVAPETPIREDLEEVLRAAGRATDLTKQLLAFSRQQMLQPKVVSLTKVVQEMEKMLRRLLGEDIALSLLTSRSTGLVYVDPGQVEQIVMNLSVNARDAMPQGGKLTIEVSDAELDSTYTSLHAGLDAGRYVLLTVTDTGEGMDASTRERIFEPFFTTKEQGKGTGLGLSTVFGIVQQSRGHLQVHSELGIGTSFKLYFPCTSEALESVVSVPPPATLRGSETILLVEDDEQVRVMTRVILKRNGYDVLDAQNAGEAFLVSEQFTATIHLLVTDVVMPLMSGRELAERLAIPRPQMKVLFLSGYTQDAILHHGVLNAGLPFLQKPITPETLLRKIRDVLRDQQQPT